VPRVSYAGSPSFASFTRPRGARPLSLFLAPSPTHGLTQPLYLVLVDPNSGYLKSIDPSSILSRWACLSPSPLTLIVAGFTMRSPPLSPPLARSLSHILPRLAPAVSTLMARRKITDEELLARAESNIYKRGAQPRAGLFSRRQEARGQG